MSTPDSTKLTCTNFSAPEFGKKNLSGKFYILEFGFFELKNLKWKIGLWLRVGANKFGEWRPIEHGK